MNDYWNDPPDDTFEPPECCDDIMEIMPDGALLCKKCGSKILPAKDQAACETWENWKPGDDNMTNFPDKCPHGKEWFACDACDQASDFLHDANREKRHFGK